MTDFQYKSVLRSVEMILEGCKDLQEAKEKIRELRQMDDRPQDEKRQEK